MKRERLGWDRLLKVGVVILIGAIAAASWPTKLVTASQLPYDTSYKDGFDEVIELQAAYIPSTILAYQTEIKREDGTIKYLQLNQPKDVFVDQKDHIYIADTGNNRVVQLDADGQYIREIKVEESPLKAPSGLFVDDQGLIYIADTGNNRIVKLNQEGQLLQAFDRPDTSYFPDTFKYDPVNVVVDKRGFMFVASLGSFQGLVQLDTEGEFVGFFGPNTVAFSLFDAFKRFVYTREMYQRELKKLPGAIANVDIDEQGFIYTVTKEVENDQVKKLNIAGQNQLTGKQDFKNLRPVQSYGEMKRYSYHQIKPQLNDITVDRYGNITVIDSVWNIISQYDSNGNLLFFWGSEATDATSKTGVVKTPVAIANNSKGDLLILDSTNNLLQVLRLSEFGRIVHEANALTQEGKYEESEVLWTEVDRLMANYAPAKIGLAKAAYKKEDYVQAQKLYLEAGVVQGYSEAFWQNRLVWFQHSFAYWLNIALIASILFLFRKHLTRVLRLGRLKKERNIPGIVVWRQLKYSFYILKHPIDGFYQVRYENKAGFGGSIILFLLAVISYGMMQGYTSFIFNPKIAVGIDIFPRMIQFAGIWIGWVISNFLVSSLLRGEGRLRDVFNGSSYIIFPIILIGLPLTILSHALTLNEQAIFEFIQLAISIWIILLAIWMVQGIHNYTFVEAIMISILSIITLIVIVILLFFVISLSIELIDFIKLLYQEVIVR